MVSHSEDHSNSVNFPCFSMVSHAGDRSNSAKQSLPNLSPSCGYNVKFCYFLLADELAKAGYLPVGVSRLVAAKACTRAGAMSLAEMIGMDLGHVELPAEDKQALQAIPPSPVGPFEL